MKLSLEDLKPQESKLELSEKPGKTYVLKKFSLAVQIWVKQHFGEEKIKYAFENKSLPEISEIAHYLLKDKTDFPSLESFQEAIVTQQDRVAVLSSVMETVGLSQPVLEKLAKEEEAQEPGNETSPDPLIGAHSST
jgi:hypothetical protein